ncbi:MAG: GNAT family N-acetyltransferase [Marinilabiliales bacterium]|nr:MAG: GNAT family N-acetyltransferase [Marinilabiliales bacterium]
MPKVTIRQYQSSDKDFVWQLHLKGLHQMNSFIDDPNLDKDLQSIEEVYINNKGEFFIATIHNQIVGIGALKKIDNEHAEIKRMRVDQEFQGQKIGSQILDSLIQKAQELSYKKLILDTSIKMHVAQNLYQSRGFDEYKRDTIGGLETIFYEKVL